MTKIKICGLTKLEEIGALNKYKPDYAGFVFYKGSSRNVTWEQAEKMRKHLHPDIQAVGVFVNASQECIKELVTGNIIQIVQLHGQENEDDIRKLRNILPEGTGIIKAFQVNTKNDLNKALQTTADYPLLDHGAGGSGECFDWNILEEVEREFFLAGGLNVNNVKQAIQMTNPYAVDVSSGVETNKVKDLEKVREFIEKVRRF